MPIAASLCLAVAATWQALVLVVDDRRIRRQGGQAYRSGLGWTDADLLRRRRRWYPVPLVAGPGLALSTTFPERVGYAVGALCCAVLLVWIGAETRFTRARFTNLCLALLAGALLLQVLDSRTTLLPNTTAPLAASFFAAQLYLVAGIRKLRSPQFLSGRVLLDNLVYGSVQADAGNREFPPLFRPHQLPAILERGYLSSTCRVGAIIVTAAELTLGLGALGWPPARPTLILAVITHTAFLLISPIRILPFSSASLGLLVVATEHPILAGIR